jgi:replicative DNA helicase
VSDSSPQDTTSPHSLEAERAVIGSVIISPKTIRPLLDAISGDDFFRHAHRLIWAAMVDCHAQEQQTDLVSVRAKLELRGDLEAIGGPAYLAALTDGVPRSTDADHYARVVVEHADRRRLQAVCREGIEEFGGATNPAESANGLVDHIREAVRGSRNQGVMLKDSIKQLMAELDAPTRLTNTGFESLDKLGCGFRPGELTLLSGRPSSGKTALALHLAKVVAETGMKVWFASLEMRHTSLSLRLLSAQSGVDYLLLRQGELNQSEYARLAEGVEHLSSLPVYVDDAPGMSLGDLRRMVVGEDPGLLVVDYLQLLKPPHNAMSYGNRVQEVGAISRGLKAIAHECDVSVLALSQLSRDVEKRGRGGEPQLSDLRDSGELEQDSDVCLLMWRPSVYDDSEPEDLTVVKVAKNRNGPVGKVFLSFVGERQSFAERDMTLVPPPDIIEKAARRW